MLIGRPVLTVEAFLVDDPQNRFDRGASRKFLWKLFLSGHNEADQIREPNLTSTRFPEGFPREPDFYR